MGAPRGDVTAQDTGTQLLQHPAVPLSAQGTPGPAKATSRAGIHPARSLQGGCCSRPVGARQHLRYPAQCAAHCTELPTAASTPCAALASPALSNPLQQPPAARCPRAGLGEPPTPCTPCSPYQPSSRTGDGDRDGPSSAASAERSRLRQKPHLSPHPAAAPRAPPGTLNKHLCCHQLPLIDPATCGGPGDARPQQTAPREPQASPAQTAPCTAPGQHMHTLGHTQGCWHMGPAPSPHAASDPLQHPHPHTAAAPTHMRTHTSATCTRMHTHFTAFGQMWGECWVPAPPKRRRPHAGTPGASPTPQPMGTGAGGQGRCQPVPRAAPTSQRHPGLAGDTSFPGGTALGPAGSPSPGWDLGATLEAEIFEGQVWGFRSGAQPRAPGPAPPWGKQGASRGWGALRGDPSPHRAGASRCCSSGHPPRRGPCCPPCPARRLGMGMKMGTVSAAPRARGPRHCPAFVPAAGDAGRGG